MVESAEVYTAVAGRLLELALKLSEPQQNTVPAPTPEWTVADTYCHLAGATADFLDEHLDGMGTPAWTAAQVAARVGRSLLEVCAEWASRFPLLAARMATDPNMLPRLALDYWTHEQDIRAAVGLRPLREDPAAALMADTLLNARRRGYTGAGGPAVRVVASDGPVDVVLGVGEPEVMLSASAFELLRMVNSRRSLAQWLAADWTGGDTSLRMTAAQALATFPLPPADLFEE
jgi:uncharacterized protein (TIGR03083 family)